MSKSAYGRRLSLGLEHAGITQSELAAEIGIKPQTVQWAATKGKGSTHTSEFARVLGISSHWLATGEGEMVNPDGHQADMLDDDFNGRYALVNRVHGSVLSAGEGAYSWEYEEVDRSHAFRREWMKDRGLKPHRCKLWQVKGESMSPYLEDGDIVLINLDSTTIVSGQVYALAAGDELRVKRLFRRLDGALEVRSDNPSTSFPTETYDQHSQVALQVIGRVEWRGG